MISYFLVPNKLSTADEAAYLPRTIITEPIELGQVITEISRGTTVMPADAKAVLENLSDVALANLKRGRSVNLGFINLRPVVRGVFQSATEPFTPGKHRFEVSVSASPAFKKNAALGVNVVRVEQRGAVPVAHSLVNMSTDDSSAFTTGDMAKIHGSYLRFDKSNANLGIFLVNGAQSIRVSEYGDIKSKSVVFKIPMVSDTGIAYKIQVRSLFGQEIRSGESASAITLS